jgi:hypothetical protein
VSLFCELSIVAALSLFCIITLHQVLPAVILICGLYLLGRSITAMRLMVETDLLGTMGGARPAINFGAEALGYLIPALDQFTLTEWISERAAAASVLVPIASQTVIAMTVLVTAALFDFHRRQI